MYHLLYCRYEADPNRRDRFYYVALGGAGEAPSACTPEIMRTVAFQHLAGPAVWTIFPIQVRSCT